MLDATQVSEFDRNGYLNGGRVLDDADVDELRDELDRVIARGKSGFAPDEPQPVRIADLGKGKSGGEVWQIVNIWEASPAFERLLYLRTVAEGISQLAHHDEIQIWHDQIQYKPPHHGGINNWHQDAPYWPVIRPYGASWCQLLMRSEEHTSELQSPCNLVCRLLLEKKNTRII